MRILLITAAFLPLAACHASWDHDGAGGGYNAKNAGPMTSRTYDLAGFTAVDLRGSDDVDVKVGPAFSVKAEGGANVLDDLEITVQGAWAAKNVRTWCRRSLRRNRTAPDASAPWTWKTLFARSIPIVLTSSIDASLKWCSTPPLWHSEAVGGRLPHQL